MIGEQPTMADVLDSHWSASTHSDHKPFVDKCDGCGEVVHTWGDDPNRNALAAHQAAALSAAGFGPVREARAEAWGECARDAYEKTGEEGLMDALRNTNPYRKDAQ